MSLNALSGEKVIYGIDNRQNYWEMDKQFQVLADATAMMVRSKQLRESGFDYTFTRRLLGKHYFGNQFENGKLCSNEDFRDEVILGDCSAFLIANDILVTAGHCISNLKDCQSKKWVFRYNKDRSDSGRIPREDVYNCQEILSHNNSDKDHAVIKLNRKVSQWSPLRLSQSKIELNDSVFTIGYPSGLPVKLALGGKVVELGLSQLKSNLDTFAGNSGSPVFNRETNEVIGLLVKGQTDYIFDVSQGCFRVNRCPERIGGVDCNGESVTLINALNLKEILQKAK